MMAWIILAESDTFDDNKIDILALQTRINTDSMENHEGKILFISPPV